MGQLRARMHRVISRVYCISPERAVKSCREHRAIADAVLKGNADLAARRIEEHLEYGKLQLLSPRRQASVSVDINTPRSGKS